MKNQEETKNQEIKDLKQLVEFLKEQQVAEFDLDRGDLKIRLKFSGPAPIAVAHVMPSVASPAVAHAPMVAASAPAPAAAPVDENAGLHIVKSPIVGTFYGSPSPGAPPFVSPGDRVEKGTIVGIVEAMKLMNEIESDAAGEVVKCFVTNGQPIEFGQPLFAVRS